MRRRGGTGVDVHFCGCHFFGCGGEGEVEEEVEGVLGLGWIAFVRKGSVGFYGYFWLLGGR